MRGMSTLGAAVIMLTAAFVSSGCEKTIDPATGDRTARMTVPGTAAHGERLDERWRRCLSFRSQSTCQRRLPGSRPVDQGPAASSSSDASEHQTDGTEPAAIE